MAAEEEEVVIRARAKKWDDVEKDKFKQLVKKGELKWDGNAAHREAIRDKHWPGRNKETFRRNWNTSAAEFRVAAFKDGARARSAGKGEKVASEFLSLCCLLSHCLWVHSKDNDSDSSSDSGDEEDSEEEEEEEEESEGEADINDIDNSNSNMVTPTKKAKSPPKAATSTTKAKKIKTSEVESIAKGIGGMSIGITKLFSFKCLDQFFTRPKVPHAGWGEVKDYTEVDIKVGMPITEDYISVTLSPDGQRIIYKKATHEMFGEADRMKVELGTNTKLTIHVFLLMTTRAK
jgi:hypothetical protein